ncbi:MAG: hypothetical protein EPO40_24920, partial [Myxococcaceae bacterium]
MGGGGGGDAHSPGGRRRGRGRLRRLHRPRRRRRRRGHRRHRDAATAPERPEISIGHRGAREPSLRVHQPLPGRHGRWWLEGSPMSARIAAMSALLGLSLVTPLAAAQGSTVCERGRIGPRLPLGVTLGEADLGMTPSPCGGRVLSLEGRGTALLELDDFYGAIDAGAVISGSYPLSDRWWLSGAIAPLQFRFVQNASIAATTLGLGATTLGLHAWLVDGPRWRVSAYGRLRVPTETGRQYAATVGVEPGVAALWSPSPRVTVALGASLQGLFTVLGSHTVSRMTAQVTADVGVLLRWFEPVLGAELRVGTDDDGAFEYIAPKLG